MKLNNVISKKHQISRSKSNKRGLPYLYSENYKTLLIRIKELNVPGLKDSILIKC